MNNAIHIHSFSLSLHFFSSPLSALTFLSVRFLPDFFPENRNKHLFTLDSDTLKTPQKFSLVNQGVSWGHFTRL